MATKPDRYKKLPPLKKSGAAHRGIKKDVKLTKAEIAEGQAASEKLAKRPTKDFSTEELGALMQTAPGGAEPHQIKTQSRQFKRVVNDLPESRGVDVKEAMKTKARPMSQKTPKIDEND
jgi:hypothetical protein